MARRASTRPTSSYTASATTASFTTMVVDGGDALDAVKPDGAFELVGVEQSALGSGAPAIGNVVFNDVVVTGEFAKAPVGIYNYSDVGNLIIEGTAPDTSGLDLSESGSGWTANGADIGINFDGIGGDIDATQYEVVGPDGGIAFVLQGEKPGQAFADGQQFTGTEGADAINGKAGADEIDGNGGSDIIDGGTGHRQCAA